MSATAAHRIGDVIISDDALGILTATIDSPGNRNALSPKVLTGLAAAVDQATRDGNSVLIIRGTGGDLSAGADLTHLSHICDDHLALGRYIADIGAVNLTIEESPAISIAVIDGFALAGGCELLLACDLGVASENSKIGDRHQEYGLLPGAGASVRLPRAIAAPLARRLMLSGEIISGATAHAWGLVSHLAPANQLDQTVASITARLVRHSPVALTGMKRMYRESEGRTRSDALNNELTRFLEHIRTQDAQEGLAAFRDGRHPIFTRQPEEETR